MYYFYQGPRNPLISSVTFLCRWLARGISFQKAKSIQLNKEPSSSFSGLIFPFALIFPKNEKNKQSNKPQPLWSYTK